MNFRGYVAKKTLKMRRKFVAHLCPNIPSSLEQLDRIYAYSRKTPRPMVLFAKKHFAEKQSLRCVEIGVASGTNALSILKELSVEQLFLVDPYLPYEDAVLGGETWHTDYSNERSIAHIQLAEYPQVVWLEKTSELAIMDFRKPVDFVYIDGNHSYESVKKDIALYYPLVKNNGLIGGHDYAPFYETVMKAVDEFAVNRDFHTVFPDWWIVKHE